MYKMEAVDDAEVTFAGIDNTTGDVLLAGQMIIGLKPGISTISSIGLCDIPGFEGSEGSLLAVGDSAVCTNPTSEQLASIAISACDTVSSLLDWEPRCAMVSYSTLGSGQGELIDKVVGGVKIANELRPDLAIDGEFQFDSAISPTCANGVIHPAALGSQLAHEFAAQYGKKAMVVNPPDVDELQDLARMTGIKGVNRIIHLHALNLKETAIRHSKNVMNKKYEECSYIVCHIGGGISVSAHQNGKMVDGYDIVGGEGPMAPTRSGSVAKALYKNRRIR